VNIMINTEDDDGRILTVDLLAKAIKNSIDSEGMQEKAAKAMALHVMNFFGYNDRVIDNILEPEDRDAFYILEDSGLLTTEREETTLFDGREWRIHYWKFRKNRIFELSFEEELDIDPEMEAASSVYEDIPEDIWSFREEEPEY